MRDPESPLPASSPGAGAGKEGLGTGFHGRPARLTRNLYISHWPEGLGHWMAFHLQVREAPGLLAFASPMAARPPQEKGFLFTLQELVRGVAPAHNTADATKQISHQEATVLMQREKLRLRGHSKSAAWWRLPLTA